MKLNEYDRRVVSLIRWRGAAWAATFMAVAFSFYQSTTDHRPLQLLAAAVLFLFPMGIGAIIAYDLGKEAGKSEGFRRGYADGHSQGADSGRTMVEEAKAEARRLRATVESLQRNAARRLEESREDGADGVDRRLAHLAEPMTSLTIDGKLGRLALATQERFWNRERGFDPVDRDTFSSQDTIIEWIKEQQPGISQAKAKAVELVACPIER